VEFYSPSRPIDTSPCFPRKKSRQSLKLTDNLQLVLILRANRATILPFLYSEPLCSAKRHLYLRHLHSSLLIFLFLIILHLLSLHFLFLTLPVFFVLMILVSCFCMTHTRWRLYYSLFFFYGATAASGPGPPPCWGFTITLGRAPLDAWSDRSRDLYLTTLNIHKTQTPMPPAEFETTIPAIARPQTQSLDRAAAGIGLLYYLTNLQLYPSSALKFLHFSAILLLLLHHSLPLSVGFS
jgi:hypothetical protein